MEVHSEALLLRHGKNGAMWTLHYKMQHAAEMPIQISERYTIDLDLHCHIKSPITNSMKSSKATII